MEFRTFVEAGRVALIDKGKDYGKLVVIVDVLDQNKCLVDGPCTGVKRQLMPYKHLQLTTIKIPVKRGSKPSIVKRHFENEKVAETFASSAWGKKLEVRNKRAALSDYDRFKVMVLRKKRSSLLNKEFKSLKKAEA
uniref:Large ribosomal subunit protein eL14 domain-containing protein n=1 Tax=Rhodosorus marinus TaxID=101924 RepID=A0A7S2ZLT4_9RHOD|mmetsp:Transcript_23698/g.93432  ORF Transcript_23698/g.93432 Transcript_23698/m.93432 type:complete len:136 (+) Transcript_23698:181-588(+)